MDRLLYAGTPADFTIGPDGRPIPNAGPFTVSRFLDDTPVTDLLDANGHPATQVTSDSIGLLRFYGPPGNFDEPLVITGSNGVRLIIKPVQTTRPKLVAGTVTTGSPAAATITGDDITGYRLDLVLPPVAPGSINTAALAPKSVTKDKVGFTPAEIGAATAADLATTAAAAAAADSKATAAVASAAASVQPARKVQAGPGLKGGGALSADVTLSLSDETQALLDRLPDTSTDNTLVRFDGTAGSLQGSPVTVADDGAISGGYVVRPGGRFDRTGPGSPEGVLAGPVGSTWTQTDSPTALGGVLVWRKRTGTGATGWRVVEGETPTWNIAALFTPMTWGTVHTFQVKRVNQLVECMFEITATALAAGANYLPARLPAGFEATAFTGNHDDLVVDSSGTVTAALLLRPAFAPGLYRIPAPPAGTRFRGFKTFLTADAWPSAAPV